MKTFDVVVVQANDVVEFKLWFSFSIVIEYDRDETGCSSLVLEFGDSSRIKYPNSLFEVETC